MYCANCGAELPNWARYCERCGARVTRIAKDGELFDPIEQLALDDTSVEPLWDDLAELPDDPGPAAPDGEETVFMGLSAKDLSDDVGQPVSAPRHGTFGTTEETVADEAASEAASGETVLMEGLEEPEGDLGEPDEDGMPDDDEAPAEGPRTGDDPEPSVDDTESPMDDAEVGPDGSDEPDHERVGTTEAGAWRQRDDRRTIDVGADDGWNMDEAGAQGYVSQVRRAYDRPSERTQGPSMMLVAGLAVAAMALALFAAFRSIFLPVGGGVDEEQQVARQAVSSADATAAIASLDGWWKTDRTLDGRYWHLEDGLMEVYAADGRIASQVLLDPSSVEHLGSGPGGIEGAGYYFRDIAYYLTDTDPDTLHALGADGGADEDANLFRTEVPSFMGGGEAGGNAVSETEVVEGDDSEYILPESSTRVYEAWELEGLSDHDLFVARNEIYARHGYIFETGELSEYFGSKSWYLTSDVFNEGALSEVERANVSTILSIEQARGSQYV